MDRRAIVHRRRCVSSRRRRMPSWMVGAVRASVDNRRSTGLVVNQWRPWQSWAAPRPSNRGYTRWANTYGAHCLLRRIQRCPRPGRARPCFGLREKGMIPLSGRYWGGPCLSVYLNVNWMPWTAVEGWVDPFQHYFHVCKNELFQKKNYFLTYMCVI